MQNQITFGYCTNVHAGELFDEMKDNLKRYSIEVRKQFCPDETLGIGLWLSAKAAKELLESDGVAEFSMWLNDNGLQVFTINGFPYGNFHQTVVKHDVYKPDWRDERRLQYTIDLSNILVQLLPDDAEGSISTLPLGWKSWFESDKDIEAAINHLHKTAEHLKRLEEQTSKCIHVDLEPEPGCFLEYSKDVALLYKDHLLNGRMDKTVLRYIRVCHDICHAAVMFENQHDMFKLYDSIGIRVGKIQVSSAVRARFDSLSTNKKILAYHQLSQFREERYLHQTVIKSENGIEKKFYDDLPDAFSDYDNVEEVASEWRTHFHVPIHLKSFGYLETTQEEIKLCLKLLANYPDVKHYEVETYAWDVLPKELKGESLVEDIVQELTWFKSQLEKGSSV